MGTRYKILFLIFTLFIIVNYAVNVFLSPVEVSYEGINKELSLSNDVEVLFDDYGVPSKLPWALSFENGLPPTTISTFTDGGPLSFLGYSQDYLENFLIEGSNSVVSVHPTQIYEMLLYFLGFYIIRKFFSKTDNIAGLTSSIYLMYAGFSRFIVEILRTNERYYLDLSSAQFISIIIFFIGFSMLLNIKYKIFDGNN